MFVHTVALDQEIYIHTYINREMIDGLNVQYLRKTQTICATIEKLTQSCRHQHVGKLIT